METSPRTQPAMSSRPKRKATNRSYNDTLDETVFEERPSVPAKKGKKTPKNTVEARKAPKEPPATLPISNWQPPIGPDDIFTQRLDLTGATVDTHSQQLMCPQAPGRAAVPPKRRKKEPFLLQKGDYIYMVSEPPGEPYYIGRILGFKEKHKQETNSSPDAANFVFQIQWYYRPRDISKATLDLRLLYASMHTDTCPLASFRGKVTVQHKHMVEQQHGEKTEGGSPTPLTPLEAYSQRPNCFYFDKLFDRYMLKFYDIVATELLLEYLDNPHNNSHAFLTALHKRFEFVFMELARTKLFLHGFSSTLSCHCGICGEWCLGPESVVCGVCHGHYHMLCLDPPLLKKPSRGFLWSCAPCTKKHEIEHQSKKMLMLSHDNKLLNEHELTREMSVLSSQQAPQSLVPPSDEDSTESPHEGLSTPSQRPDLLPKYERMAADFLDRDSALSLEERRLKEEWPMRYLGMHARLEDGVDVDDRSPYPRASTRLGAKHQATHIPEFEDHPIVYYDTEKGPVQARKKAGPPKKAKKVENDVVLRLEVPEDYRNTSPKDYPRWLQPRPKGYVERGVDGETATSTLLWKPLQLDENNDFRSLDAYIAQCGPIAEKLGLHPNSPNFVDAILNLYFVNNGLQSEALIKAQKLTRESLKEPTFSPEEVKKFEAGIKKFGSELYPTYKKVKSQLCAMVVRFYYLWKKTENGREIWGNFEGRMQKKLQNVKDENKAREGSEDDSNGTVNAENGSEVTENGTSLPENGTKESRERPAIDQYADPEDDSAYDKTKIAAEPRPFYCKHCSASESTQWYRITGYNASTKHDPGKEGIDKNAVTALCLRCARLWRRYAVIWDDPYEVEKRNTRGVGGWKKKVEAELVRDSEAILAHLSGESVNVGLQNDIGATKASPAVQTASSSPKKRAVAAKRAPAKAVKSEELETPLSRARKPKKVKEEEAPKDLKQEENETKEEPKKAKPGPKKRTSAKDGSEAPTPKAKRKKKAANPETGKLSKYDALLAEAHTKKQKKGSPSGSGPEEVLSAVVNRDYLLPETLIPEGPLSIASLGTIISNFREYQLISLQEQMDSLQDRFEEERELLEATTALDTEKPATKTPVCGVCLEEDTSDLLTCASCDASAHISCVGLPVPKLVEQPLSGWLCEPCGNELDPQFRADYECCLCERKGDEVEEGVEIRDVKGEKERDDLRIEEMNDALDTTTLAANASLLSKELARNVVEKTAFSQEKPFLQQNLLSQENGSSLNGAPSQKNASPHEKSLLPEGGRPQEAPISQEDPVFKKNESIRDLTLAGNSSLKNSPSSRETGGSLFTSYLKPVRSTGQWCHWLCALFAHEDVSFKQVTSPVYVRRTPENGHDKDKTLVSEAILAHTAIESILAVLVSNLNRLCGLCGSQGGALITCASCEDTFHVSCAQNAPKFRVGFTLTPTKLAAGRGHQPLARVGDQTGILVPNVLCNKHDESTPFFELRERGRRVHGVGREEKRPLIQLFLEDAVRANSANKLRLSGPQFLAHNYMKTIRQLMNGLLVQQPKETFTGNSCSRCHTPASPMWWPTGAGTEDVFCQGCHHSVKTALETATPEEVVPSLLEILNEPLDGSNYGLASTDDRLADVFTPACDVSRDPNEVGNLEPNAPQMNILA